MFNSQTQTARVAFSVAELASSLGLSQSFIRAEISKRRLAVVRVGDRVLVMPGDVDAWLRLKRESSNETNKA